MRVTTFGAWFSAAVRQGVGYAKKAGLAVSRRVRSSSDEVEASSGVGDDDAGFGGRRGSRAWIDAVEDYVERVFAAVFEKSTFDRRFPRVEGWFRHLLGLPAKAHPLPPPLPKLPPRAPARPATTAEQAARFKEQLRRQMQQAHTRDRINLREVRRGSSKSDPPPEE